MRLNRVLAACLALAVCATTFASSDEYTTTVQQGFDSAKPVKSIGLVPFDCPDKVDCEDLQEELAEQLAERTGARIVEASAVRDLMTRASMPNLEDREARLIIGEGLGVDAFAFVTIDKAEVNHVRADQAQWNLGRRDTSIKRASLELRIVARDSTQLAHVSGAAALVDSVKGLSSITEHLLSVMIDRTWL